MCILAMGQAAALALAVAAPAAGGATSEAVMERSDRTAKSKAPVPLTAFFDAYFAAVEEGDPEKVLAVMDTDFLVKWPAGEPISDRAQLRAALASMQQAIRQEIEWEVLEGALNGDWAWARVREKATHFLKANGKSRVLEGSHLAILRRRDGRWLLHRDYGSLNAAPGEWR